MRDFKNMKRQRGRNRGGGMGAGNGGGGKPQQNANRAFDSNGPENVKIRGHAQHVFEKYQQLARDAFSSGDRVVAENYLQHADHYFRLLRALQPQRSASEILGRDSLVSGLDIDFEEEFDPPEEGGDAPVETAPDLNGGGEGQPRAEFRRDERYERADTRRDGYEARADRFEPRRDGEGQYRDRPDTRERPDTRDRGDSRDRPSAASRDRVDARDRPEGREGAEARDRQDRGEGRPDRFEGRRDNRRFEGRREERPFNRETRGEERRPLEAAPYGDPLPVIAPEAAAPLLPTPSPEADSSPVLRSQDGGMSEAPAFLQPAAGEEGEARKPRARRRRAPRSFEASESGEAPASLAEAEEA